MQHFEPTSLSPDAAFQWQPAEPTLHHSEGPISSPEVHDLNGL